MIFDKLFYDGVTKQNKILHELLNYSKYRARLGNAIVQYGTSIKGRAFIWSRNSIKNQSKILDSRFLIIPISR